MSSGTWLRKPTHHADLVRSVLDMAPRISIWLNSRFFLILKGFGMDFVPFRRFGLSNFVQFGGSGGRIGAI